jgi:hypothetical protein
MESEEPEIKSKQASKRDKTLKRSSVLFKIISLMYRGKCFTYVTKTWANLTTYSRKPENYNGTIIFEIDIMKNSSPINLNLCQT